MTGSERPGGQKECRRLGGYPRPVGAFFPVPMRLADTCQPSWDQGTLTK